jgi:hypothetical protein
MSWILIAWFVGAGLAAVALGRVLAPAGRRNQVSADSPSDDGFVRRG